MSQGANMLLTGMVIQLVGLVAFFVLLYAFFNKVTRYRHLIDLQHPNAKVHQANRFRIFLICKFLDPPTSKPHSAFFPTTRATLLTPTPFQASNSPPSSSS